MFSKELENLIQATLVDGVLEPYELEALQKRAKAEGVDLTELEIYINSLLQKRNRELKEKEAAAKQQADEKRKAEMQTQVKEAKIQETANLKALGYKECPKCHKQVSPLTLVCECGFEFTVQKEVSSIQKLFEMLNSIKLTPSEEKEIAEAALAEQQAKRESFYASKRIEIISTFPVPNTKVDIIEFLSTSVSLANKKVAYLKTRKGFLVGVVIAGLVTVGIALLWVWGTAFGAIGILYIVIAYYNQSFAEEKLKDAWRAKCEQVLMKGRSLRSDAEFTQQLDYYESLLNKK